MFYFLVNWPSAQVYNANIKIAVKLLFCCSFSFTVTYIHSQKKKIPIFGQSYLAGEFHCPVDGQGDSCLVTVPRHPLHVHVHILWNAPFVLIGCCAKRVPPSTDFNWINSPLLDVSRLKCLNAIRWCFPQCPPLHDGPSLVGDRVNEMRTSGSSLLRRCKTAAGEERCRENTGRHGFRLKWVIFFIVES